MERQEILEAMSELKLYGMRASFHEIAGKGLTRRDELYPLIASLIRAERTHRQARSIGYRVAGAKFPAGHFDTLVMETTRGIRKRGATRPVVVAVITPGVDLSDRPYESALEPLLASGAAFHVVVVGRPITGGRDRQVFLDRGTAQTGGRYDTVLTGTGLAPRMKQLATELTHQYKVTYARPDTLIPPDRVAVSAAKPGLTVRGIAQLASAEGGRR